MFEQTNEVKNYIGYQQQTHNWLFYHLDNGSA